MKAIQKKGKRIWLWLLILGCSLPLQARDHTGFFTVSGVVKDQKSKKKLEFVTVSVPGTGIGTITNADGGFSIKVSDTLQATALEISHIGYFNKQIPIEAKDTEDVNIFLTPNVNTLQEVIVKSMDPRKLVEEAINKIPVNNSINTNMLTGFYRETIKKRRNYITISEAIVNIYKTPYSQGIESDRTQIYKGRQLLSPKRGDTLIVKLQGGPNLSILLDIVKNRDFLLDKESLSFYTFKMDDRVMIDDRMHYVVSFEPAVILPYALFYGKLYIDEVSLAVSQAEFNMCMDDKNKATQAILRKKPFKLRFKPEEITYLVTYKQQNGISYLNYVRNEIRFKCDWKRRLFSTGYEVISELVVTDKKEHDVVKIPNKLAFNSKHSLSDQVGNFYDENFWEDYNIIEPTESLESAVNKLKKKHK
jgi:hypothetical protein